MIKVDLTMPDHAISIATLEAVTAQAAAALARLLAQLSATATFEVRV